MISFEMAAVFARLQAAESRLDGARALAALCGAQQVLVFGKDTEVDVFLPAPGMPQTLHRADQWQPFLRQCVLDGSARAALPWPGAEGVAEAVGVGDARSGAVLVFVGGDPVAHAWPAIGALLPFIGDKLAQERAALSAGGSAAAARQSSRRAEALNVALDMSRRELQSAYQRAESELVFRRDAERRLRDADRRKDDFLAMLAHELRNPLAPISMAAQLLNTGKVSDERVRQTSAVIERQVNHMTTLLDDLLDVSRVTRGLVTLAHELHPARAIVQDALEQARPLLIARKHSLTVRLDAEPDAAPARVRGDGTRLVQIVTNILNNAIKYTPPGGNIGLEMRIGPERVEIAVCDDGIGIEAKLLPHIFDLFTQGERSPDRAQGGLGLGLALARNLVEQHGGTLAVHSEGAGRGSRFVVGLPRAFGAQQSAAADLPGGAGRGALRVLIVDDNGDAAATLAQFLEDGGHAVRVAFDARGAMRMVCEAPADVLLLDIGLPDIDGYALARQLRCLTQCAHAVFIAVTGYGQEQDRELSRLAGFDHHLTKPVDAAALVRLLALPRGAPMEEAPAPDAGDGAIALV
ncbi:MAG: ATP-binding protein [Pseudomonadota bacterium]